MRICLAASAGGHLTQLLTLSQCWEGEEFFFVSTKDESRVRLEKLGKTYIVGECNREHPIKTWNVLWQTLGIVLKERPHVVMSTGAAPPLLVCLWAKLLGARIIWVDSIANIERLSMSGRIVRPFADVLISQWSDVAQKDGKIEYLGALV